MSIEFCFLKDVLCGIPSLTLPVPSDEFILQTDASGIGLVAVLSSVSASMAQSRWPALFAI